MRRSNILIGASKGDRDMAKKQCTDTRSNVPRDVQIKRKSQLYTSYKKALKLLNAHPHCIAPFYF